VANTDIWDPDAYLRLAKTAAPLRFTWTWPDIDLRALDPAMVIVAREPDGPLANQEPQPARAGIPVLQGGE
jgi:hypothetical protein